MARMSGRRRPSYLEALNGLVKLWPEWLVEEGFPTLAGESPDGLVLEPEMWPEWVVEGLPTLTAVESLDGVVKLWPGRLVDDGIPILAGEESPDGLVLEPELWPEWGVEKAYLPWPQQKHSVVWSSSGQNGWLRRASLPWPEKNPQMAWSWNLKYSQNDR